MTFKLKITITVINRRIADGEKLDEILLCYPKLTVKEIEQIRSEIGK